MCTQCVLICVSFRCVLSLIGLFMLVGTLYDLLLYQPWLKIQSQPSPVIANGVSHSQRVIGPTVAINGVIQSKLTGGSTSTINGLIHNQEKGGSIHEFTNNLENGGPLPTVQKQEFGGSTCAIIRCLYHVKLIYGLL